MSIPAEHISLTEGWEGVIYREWDFPAEVIETWNRLSTHCGDIGIFVRYEWFEYWWRAFGSKGDLFVVILMKNGLIRAIFPCCFKNDAANGKNKRCIMSLTNDYTYHYDFIIESGLRHAALSQFVRLVNTIYPDGQLFFDYMRATDDNFISFTDELNRQKIPTHSYSESWAPWTTISGEMDSFEKSLASRLKNNLRRCRKKAEQQGKLCLEIVRHSEHLDSILDVAFQIEYNSWKGRDGTAIKCNADTEEFFRGIACWAMMNNYLHLFIISMGDMPIAMNFCFNSGRTLFGLKQGYDESAKNLSPGNLLFFEMFDYLFKTPELSIYNFFGACEPWKMEWTRQMHKYGWIKVYPNSLSGKSRCFLDYGWKKGLKKFAAVRIWG